MVNTACDSECSQFGELWAGEHRHGERKQEVVNGGWSKGPGLLPGADGKASQEL